MLCGSLHVDLHTALYTSKANGEQPSPFWSVRSLLLTVWSVCTGYFEILWKLWKPCPLNCWTDDEATWFKSFEYFFGSAFLVWTLLWKATDGISPIGLHYYWSLHVAELVTAVMMQFIWISCRRSSFGQLSGSFKHFRLVQRSLGL